jgi:recombination protein RecA
LAKEKRESKQKALVADDKKAAAAETVLALEKRFGVGTLVCLGDRVGKKHPSIPTGIYELDHHVIGIGGVPRGRIVEVYGDTGAGKTSLTLQIIAEAQKLGEMVAFIDAENGLDPNWANTLGVDVSSLYVSQPSCGEEALEITEALIRSGAYAVVVIDSVAALTPRAEIDGSAGDAHMGLQARMLSQAMRKLTAAVAATHTTVIFINQTRMLIGVVYGNPVTTTGGKALRFYSSVRLEVSRAATIKDGEVSIGNRVRIKGAKNRMGPPFRTCEVDLLFDSGFSTHGSVVEAAVLNGAVDKAGSWFSYKGERLGQGMNNVVALLKSSPELFDKVYQETRSRDIAAAKKVVA